MLVFLLCATGVMSALALVFFTVVMSPTVIANSPAPAFKQSRPVPILSPQASKARMETERAALAKAQAMNAELGLKLGQITKSPASVHPEARSKEARPKPGRIARTQSTTHAARFRNNTGEYASAYGPQRTLAFSRW
jgi:hypothetical protein